MDPEGRGRNERKQRFHDRQLKSLVAALPATHYSRYDSGRSGSLDQQAVARHIPHEVPVGNQLLETGHGRFSNFRQAPRLAGRQQRPQNPLCRVGSQNPAARAGAEPEHPAIVLEERLAHPAGRGTERSARDASSN